MCIENMGTRLELYIGTATNHQQLYCMRMYQLYHENLLPPIYSGPLHERSGLLFCGESLGMRYFAYIYIPGFCGTIGTCACSGYQALFRV